MKYILAFITMVTLSPSFAAEQYDISTQVVKETPPVDSELKKKFLSDTKIQLGNYERLENSNLDCIDGELSIIDFGNELTLMLGARPLVSGIGKKEVKPEKDGNCVITSENDYDKNTITEKTDQVCEKQTNTFHTTVNIGSDKLTFVKDAYTDGKLVDKISCTVEKKSTKK